jgi:OOP family OmpA-OmpF porin
MKKRSLLLSTSLVLCSFAIGQESPQVAPTATGESMPSVITADTTTVPTETTVLINEEPASASSTPLLQDTVVVEKSVIKLDTLVNNQNPLDTTILVSTTTSKDMTITPKEDTHVRDGNSEKDEARVYPKVNHWSIAGHAGVAFIDGDQTQLYNDLWPKSGADIAFGFEVEYTFTPGFGLYAEYVYNPYRGSTTYYYKGLKQPSGLEENKQIPMDFDGLAHEANLGVSLNFLNMFYRYRPQTWNVYVNVGMGVAFYDVSAYDFGTKNIMDYLDKGKRVAPSIPNGRAVTFPLGISLEYNPLKWLAIVWNTQYRMHKKDNMDASEKGNDDDNTIYSGLGLRWKINSKDKTMQHIRNMSPADYEPAQCCDATVENSQKISEIVTQISALAGNASSIEEEKERTIEENLPDTDLDGVPDVRDRHPNTPSGSFVNYYGEPLDKDAVERILGYGQYVEETPSIYFDLGLSRITIESHMVLAKIARKMYADPNMKLDIVGYCDNVGGDELNNKLSMRRAEDTKRELVRRYGVSANRINTYGKGKTPGPVDDFMPNRRCDLILFSE